MRKYAVLKTNEASSFVFSRSEVNFTKLILATVLKSPR